MKILYLITKSNYGGAQKYVHELAKAAAKTHDVSVACGGTGEAQASAGMLVEKLQEEQIPVHRIRSFMRDISMTSDVRAFFEIVKILRTVRPDTLHISSSKAGGIGALAGRVTRTKNIIFTIHGLPSEEAWRPWWQKRCISALTWVSILLSHKTIVLTIETKNKLQRMPFIRNKLAHIYNGIETLDFLSQKDSRSALGINIPEHSILIGGIGELHPNKNWTLFLHSLALLPTNVHGLIIGSGEEIMPLQHTAEKLGIGDRIHFTGYVEGASKFLKAFDIYVLSSKKEGFPYVLLEAGQGGLPVVSSKLPGVMELIQHETNGLLAEQEAGLFADAIMSLIKDPKKGSGLSHSLQAKVLSAFKITTMSKKTLALYDSTMPSSPDETEA